MATKMKREADETPEYEAGQHSKKFLKKAARLAGKKKGKKMAGRKAKKKTSREM